MPLVQLVVSTHWVDTSQYLIIQHDGPFLVVGRGEKLNHLPPDTFVLVSNINCSVIIEKINGFFRDV